MTRTRTDSHRPDETGRPTSVTISFGGLLCLGLALTTGCLTGELPPDSPDGSDEVIRVLPGDAFESPDDDPPPASDANRPRSPRDAGKTDTVMTRDAGNADVPRDGEGTRDGETRGDSGAGDACRRRDKPDPNGIDADCDGIDGDRDRSIFVATDGSDNNPGTASSPKATITAGIEAAANSTSKSWVLVEGATFVETVQLAEGVHIAGGYRSNWTRGDATHTIVKGGDPTLQGRDIDDRTRLSRLTVRPTQPSRPGDSIVTVHLERAPGVVLRDVEIVGGQGGKGRDGDDGTVGDDGRNGQDGGDGTENDSFVFGIVCDDGSRPGPGPGASGACMGADGGRGGSPGLGTNDGESGTSGMAEASGGQGGRHPGGEGQAGEDGESGKHGEPGQGGDDTGRMVKLEWKGEPGQPGSDGRAGGGGGGGGGGAGGDDLCNSYGGAGGGGGSGGCGGTGGEGGRPGGASVALYLDNSDIDIKESRIVGGTGGEGGTGGRGGAGGEGGQGGDGGRSEDDSGSGGPGGNGGSGGDGGAGGGGAGGPSFVIYTTQPLSNDPEQMGTELVEGTGGSGGRSPAGMPRSRGADGQTATLQIDPFS